MNKRSKTTRSTALWLPVGVGIGSAVGIATGNLALGVGIGTAFGVLLGALLARPARATGC